MSDYPDYFGVSIFPHYGALIREGGHINTSDAIWYTVFEVEAKGKTYPSGLFVSANSNEGDSLNLIVDGDDIKTVTFSQLKAHGFTGGYYYPFFLSMYDTVYPVFSVTIAGDLTFAISFKVRYLPVDANARAVFYSFNYAKIV